MPGSSLGIMGRRLSALRSTIPHLPHYGNEEGPGVKGASLDLALHPVCPAHTDREFYERLTDAPEGVGPVVDVAVDEMLKEAKDILDVAL